MYIHKPLRITKGNKSQRNGPSSLLFIIIICPVDMNVYARFDEISSITLFKSLARFCGYADWFEFNQVAGIFLAILGGGPRAFQIGKISTVNH